MDSSFRMKTIIFSLALLVFAAACGKNNGVAPGSTGSGATADQTGCAGVDVGGYCWYLGAVGDSCTTVCSTHAGYNAATDTFANFGVSQHVCSSILIALSSPGAVIQDNCASGWGCHIAGGVRTQCHLTHATASASGGTIERVCACNH